MISEKREKWDLDTVYADVKDLQKLWFIRINDYVMARRIFGW